MRLARLAAGELDAVADALRGSEHAIVRGRMPRYPVLLDDADDVVHGLRLAGLPELTGLPDFTLGKPGFPVAIRDETMGIFIPARWTPPACPRRGGKTALLMLPWVVERA